jgi:hypothetical protein
MADARGFTLVKPRRAARYGSMAVRYVLKDKLGLLYFRSLREVERYLARRRRARAAS